MLFCIEMLHHKNQTLPSYNGSVERKTASGRCERPFIPPTSAESACIRIAAT